MRKTFLPFSRPYLGDEEIHEVVDSLKSGWITTGPKVQKFESEFAQAVAAPQAVAVNSATSGLHIAYLAAGLRPGDEVITTPMTFVATVSMILAAGAKPVLADVDRETLNLDPDKVVKKITRKTRALVPVHFAGQPCDMDALKTIAKKYGLRIIEDAAHALGTEYKGQKVGSLSDATVFSFHPIKNITTGEGGMVTTPHADWAEEMGLLRFHGMSKTAWKRYSKSGSPHYDIERLGYKYNMLDLQAGIGLAQLAKLEKMNAIRARLAQIYDAAFREIPEIILPQPPDYAFKHSWHLYVILVDDAQLKIGRDEFIQKLLEANIGVGVHYRAVHRQSYYRKVFGRASYPNAEFVSDRILSLPLYPGMTEEDARDVVEAVRETVRANLRRKAA